MLIDANGKTFGFAELLMVSTGVLTILSDHVLARVDASGTPHGYHTHSTTVMSDSGLKKLDTTELRLMRERAVDRTSREPLDEASQQKIKKLADWVRHRCPLTSNTR